VFMRDGAGRISRELQDWGVPEEDHGESGELSWVDMGPVGQPRLLQGTADPAR
jgi:hypothetical protein